MAAFFCSASGVADWWSAVSRTSGGNNMDNTSTGSPASAHDRPWLNTSLAPDERAALLLTQMTLEEKVDMLREKLGPGLPSRDLGIPVLTITDGPAGIRIDREKRYVDEEKATSLPAPIALPATWDLATPEQYGNLLGLKPRSPGHTTLL